MSLTTDVTFRRTDTSFTESNTTLTCKRFDTQASVDTTGWTLTHIQNGIYELVVPNATVKSIYSLEDNATGLITADGVLDVDAIATQDVADALKLAPTAGAAAVGSVYALIGTPSVDLATDIAAGGGGGLDEAETRAALGLAAANLDTQLTSILTAATGNITNGVTVSRTTTSDTVTLVRGDVSTITFTLGSAYNLTGKTATFTVKKSRTDTAATAILSAACTTTDAASGICTYTTATTTFPNAGRYHFDVQVADTGTGANPVTAQIGKLVITQDVTN